MAVIIKCKMCGGDLVLVENSTLATCEFCGTTQTVPNQDNEKKLTLFARANRLRTACEFDKAAGIYEAIVADFPEEAEAYWGLILCRYGIEYVDDPATGKKIPTCHRSSFDSIMDDSDFEQAMENADSAARRVYRDEAKQIEEIRKGIIAVSANEQPYDIFICYKETAENGDRTLDSVLAQDVYDALTAKGYRVFFSRITLEDKLGMEYEPYIFAALSSAKIMLAFGTDYEYFNAVWVKNEWSRYLKLMAKDKDKHLIPCFKGIDAYDMPKEFAKLQAQDLGKMGAIQDILRGIEKLLPRQTQETVVVQQGAVSNNPTIESYLERAFICLEDGDWEDVRKCCEPVLNIDSQNATAYLILLMADMEVTTKENLQNCTVPFGDNSNYKKLIRFADEALKEFVCRALEQTKKNAASRCELEFFKHAVIKADELVKYNGSDSILCIPEGIISIGAKAFYYHRKLTSVTIPNGVTSIGDYAFEGCENLASITIPDGVTSIGSYAFSNCENLTSVTIPDSVTSIGKSAFYYCWNLRSITIPDSVTSIGEYAFEGCEKLTSVTIPGSVTSIENGTFDGCKNLIAVAIPDSVTSIGASAFSGCEDLTSVAIPDGVASIGNNAFDGCNNLTSVTIPDGVTSIEERTFKGCKNLTSVTIPDSVISIGSSAFSGCEDLTSVAIPDSVTSIGEYAFDGCNNLTSVTIPNSATSIGKMAFSSCPKLCIYAPFVSYAAQWGKQTGVCVEEDEISKSKRLEAESKRREAEALAAQRRQAGLCQHCGGEMKGFFSKKCVSCGKSKDY